VVQDRDFDPSRAGYHTGAEVTGLLGKYFHHHKAILKDAKKGKRKPGASHENDLAGAMKVSSLSCTRRISRAVILFELS
jgi:hypothetical protein